MECAVYTAGVVSVNNVLVADTTVASLPQIFTMFRDGLSVLKPDPDMVNVWPPA